MDGISAAANIVAVIELSTKVAGLCFQYSKSVLNARADIERLHAQIQLLNTILQNARRLIEGSGDQSLIASQSVISSLDGCYAELEKLRSKLDLGSRRQAMRRIGLRALKWPFTRSEVEHVLAEFEKHQRVIMTGLQIDQTKLLLKIEKGIEQMNMSKTSCLSAPLTGHFVMPFPQDPDFVERPVIWNDLNEQYDGHANRIALVGLGGVGKSQIAIQFAHHVHIASPSTHILWVYGSSRATFTESYRSFADALELPRRQDSEVEVLELVRDWLQRERSGSWLMILDNVDDMNVMFGGTNGDEGKQYRLASYLPKTANGKILVTSRSLTAAERLTGDNRSIVRIDQMADSEALHLFRNKIATQLYEDCAIELITELDSVPLAVSQAAAHINRRAPRVSVRSYLDNLRESNTLKSSLLNREFGDLRRDDSVSNSVVATWQITFEQIRHENSSAADLLALMSMFQPQQIPEYVLMSEYSDGDLQENTGDEDCLQDFEDNLDILRGYSLVNQSDTGFLGMHPLVQFCTRVWLSYVKDLDRWRARFIWLMVEHFPSASFDTWPKCQVLRPHVQPMIGEVPNEEADILEWILLVGKLTAYLRQVGEPATAAALMETSVKEGRRILGEDDQRSIVSISDLASAYWDQGRWEEAEPLQVRALELSRANLGEEHANTVRIMHNLGSTYREQGKLDEAEALESKVVELRKRLLGPDHEDTLMIMTHLALTYWMQERYEEAERLNLQVIEARKRRGESDQPETLTCMCDLGMTYWSQGRLDEAETLQAEVLEARRTKLGLEHPHTLISLANLASMYSARGRLREAELLEAQALEAQNKIAPEHPRMLTLKCNLAITIKAQGRHEEAIAMLRECASFGEQVLGPEHADTLDCLALIALWEAEGNGGSGKEDGAHDGAPSSEVSAEECTQVP